MPSRWRVHFIIGNRCYAGIRNRGFTSNESSLRLVSFFQALSIGTGVGSHRWKSSIELVISRESDYPARGFVA